jgi:NAD+ kinase
VLKAYTKGLMDHATLIVDTMERAGVQVVVDENLAGALPKIKSAAIDKMKVDLIVTLGGDGTILRTLQQNPAPLFAINAGIMGFLAEAPISQAVEGLKRVLKGDFVIDSRLRLLPKLNGQGLAPCLNEVVLHTSSVAKMIHFEVSSGASVVHRIRADGLIVATPTGSTSYNLSVGGPIIDPAVSAFVLSPIAPFSLSSRPIVIPSDAEIEVRLITDRPTTVVLDGQFERPFAYGDRLTIRRAPRDAQLIRFSKDFYQRLHEKHAISF